MEINFELYKMFYNVAKNQSFSKAAETLYISQPAVTQSIQKLEEQLGGKLFYRTKKGVTLTEEGKNLLQYIKNSIETINNAENKFSQYINLEEGKIRIKGGSVLNKVLLYKPLKKFIEVYPNIRIDLSNGLTSESMNELNNGEIDMVLLNLPYENNISENITIIECKDIESGFFVSKEYYKKINKGTLTCDELSKYSLILPKKGSGTEDIIDKYLKENNLILTAKYECSSINNIADLIREGMGIGYTNKNILLNDIKNGEIIEIKTELNIYKRLIGVAIMNKDIASFASLELARFIKEYFNKIEKN